MHSLTPTLTVAVACICGVSRVGFALVVQSYLTAHALAAGRRTLQICCNSWGAF